MAVGGIAIEVDDDQIVRLHRVLRHAAQFADDEIILAPSRDAAVRD
jgi:hypothetical protein